MKPMFRPLAHGVVAAALAVSGMMAPAVSPLPFASVSTAAAASFDKPALANDCPSSDGCTWSFECNCPLWTRPQIRWDDLNGRVLGGRDTITHTVQPGIPGYI